MSKETESKRQPPNVIARLMGLDGLPPQQPLHFSETYRQWTAQFQECKDDLLGSPPWRLDDKDGHFVFAIGENLTTRCKFALIIFKYCLHFFVVFSPSRILVPYPLIPDSGILANNLGLAEIISAS
ncbi:hypothetical protein ACSBR1_031405 [Camellia fascicularis]